MVDEVSEAVALEIHQPVLNGLQDCLWLLFCRGYWAAEIHGKCYEAWQASRVERAVEIYV